MAGRGYLRLLAAACFAALAFSSRRSMTMIIW
jgi:hypothetical protein